MCKIEWCDLTINPIVGCTHCSPACDNCHWSDKVNYDSYWTAKIPKQPKRIFIGSDIFDENISYFTRDHIFLELAKYPQHTFIILTKRPETMWDYFPHNPEKYWQIWGKYGEEQKHLSWPLSNVWLGVTVCTQQEADEKIPILLKIPASKRFISVEHMLESISLTTFPDWVICGAETGSIARRMNLDWARNLRDQCTVANVPFFFKKAGNDLIIRQFPENKF